VTDIMVAVAPRGVRHMCVRMTWMAKGGGCDRRPWKRLARAPEAGHGAPSGADLKWGQPLSPWEH
jgi:hypothetical protein